MSELENCGAVNLVFPFREGNSSRLFSFRFTLSDVLFVHYSINMIVLNHKQTHNF